DTAIRYRAMRSERVLGRALADAVAAGGASRDEIFVSTKGGLIAIPEGRDRKSFVQQELVHARGIPPEHVYNDQHCLNPTFIAQELDRSLENLGLGTIDCYFIHNLELAFLTGSAAAVHDRLRAVFAVL